MLYYTKNTEIIDSSNLKVWLLKTDRKLFCDDFRRMVVIEIFRSLTRHNVQMKINLSFS